MINCLIFLMVLLREKVMIKIFALVFGLMLQTSAFALLNGKPSSKDTDTRAMTAAVETPEGLCTGTIIGRELILTAGHCVAQKGKYRVNYLDENFKIQRATVLRVAHHPEFDPADGFSSHDIGLVRIQKLPDTMKMAKLPHWFNFASQGDNVTIAGFGTTEKRGLKDGTLREAEMKTVPPTINRASFAGLLSLTDQKVGMCVGDSGGPVYKNNIVIGILKGGTTEADKTCTITPIFTPVRDYTGWIKMVAEKWQVTIGD
jgi:hypothetical protein